MWTGPSARLVPGSELLAPVEALAAWWHLGSVRELHLLRQGSVWRLLRDHQCDPLPRQSFPAWNLVLPP